MQKQVHVFYSGRVQGVGFRFTAEDLAVESGITGWAKNLRDGRVEVLAEGEERNLTDFLTKVGKHFANYIADTEAEWKEPAGEFKDFTVRFN
ncbi:MAG: acylphosphatase [Candidatus Omnitrophota bacterium]